MRPTRLALLLALLSSTSAFAVPSGTAPHVGPGDALTVNGVQLSAIFPGLGQQTLIGANINTPTADSYVSNAQANSVTAYAIYSPVNQANTYFFDVYRSVLNLQPGTTVQGGANFGGYILNQVPHTTAPHSANSVGAALTALNGATGAESWGLNTACSDRTDPSHNYASTCIGYEIDLSAYNAGSIMTGITFELGGAAQPAGATPLHISVTGSVAKWTNGLVIDSGAIASGGYAAIIGAIGTSGGGASHGNKVAYAIFDSTTPTPVGHYLIQQAKTASPTQSLMEFTDSLLTSGIRLWLQNGDPVISAVSTNANQRLILDGYGGGGVAVNTGFTLSYISTVGLLTTNGSGQVTTSAGANCPPGLPTNSFSTNIYGQVTHC